MLILNDRTPVEHPVDPEHSISLTAFMTKRFRSLPIRYQIPPPQRERKVTKTTKHYNRLIRQWYKPVISELIRERQRLKLKQSDIEEMIGCADNLVAKWENMLKMPSLYYMILWCEALGIELQPVFVDQPEFDE